MWYHEQKMIKIMYRTFDFYKPCTEPPPMNKLAKLQATLVWNYDSPTDLLTGVKYRATSVAKKVCIFYITVVRSIVSGATPPSVMALFHCQSPKEICIKTMWNMWGKYSKIKIGNFCVQGHEGGGGGGESGGKKDTKVFLKSLFSKTI